MPTFEMTVALYSKVKVEAEDFMQAWKALQTTPDDAILEGVYEIDRQYDAGIIPRKIDE